MKTFITNVKKFEFGDSFEIRCYERGLWQHDSYVESEDEAIERMNFLMTEYDLRDDEVQLVRSSYYKNIVDEEPF